MIMRMTWMPGRHLAAVLVLVLTGMFLAVLSVAPPSAAADPCGSGGNPVACENSKPGTPESEWEITGAGDSDIQGFSTDISVNAGSTIGFKIDTDARAYGITILRMGWYGGDGARQITTITPSATLPQIQPPCITDSTTELTDCGNWGLSASWAVPSTAVSGVYIAHLERVDNGDDSNITFIVRNDASHSAVVFQTSDPTWEAYNTYGGSDFYQGGAHGRAYKVSYNRPMLARLSPGGQDFMMANEYPAIRFLERNGYDLSYISGVDTDRYGSLLKNHQVFLSVGHDEYWSGAQRANVEAARDAGVNLQFLSGNEIYWRTRYEASIDPGHTPYRTLVTYKEAWAQAKIDPSPESTSTWRDPRYAPTSQGGGRPENALSGTTFMSNYTDLPLTVTRAQGSLRLWRNTGLSSMSGASTSLAPHTVGYESDEDQDNGFRPAGLIDLSTTTGQVSNYMTDYGLNTTSATTTHSLTLYKAPSGALVFSAGSVQWAWGLDDDHDTPYAYAPADSRMQQAQVNVLADMGVQPTTLMSGLSAASKSADVTAPTVTISSPAAGTAIANGTRVTVSGSASDPSGSGVAGVVAGVEYSLDGGTSWHPAQGTSSWSFTYTQHGSGTVPVQVRAVDDSANIGTAVSRSFAVACPCSIFGATPLPTTWTSVTGPSAPADTSDGSAVELGLRFTPQSDGFISGVRFYKGTGNTGTHVGSLWDSSGQRLGSVTFANETATGWQQATFGAGIPVSAGQTYTVSYTAPNGHYAYQYWAFNEAPLVAPPLQVAGGFGAAPAGVYALAGKYPQSDYEGSQYYVDALFTATDSTPLTAGSQWPAADAASVPPSTTIRATFSKAVVASSVSVSVKDAAGASVAGATTYDSTSRTVTFTPSAVLAGATKYTVTLAATDPTGVALSAGKSWSFTTAVPQRPPGVCPCSLFSDSTTPTLLEAADTNQVTLGVSFSADTAGAVTGIRFYKGPNNTGTHTGTLWSAGGVKLAEGTFTNEPSSGWATLTFSQPVSIAKNTTYVASYRTEVGNYSATPNAFAASDLSYGPLHVTSTAGAYSYGAAFPTTATSNSYLVDLVFTPTGSTGSTGLTLFPGQVPQYASTDDSAAVELGTAFVPAKDGVVSGIGFYKGSGNDGTHVGHLWSASGALLASVTFTGESSQGWQTATLSTPVAVTAGTTYVVSYLAPLGHYANTPNYFASDYTAGGLTAPAGGNGRYLYGAGGGFPTSTYQATNYFVDVAYTAGGVAPSPSPSASASASATPTATASASPSVTVSPSATPSATPPPLTITSRTPASGATNVSRSVKPAATLSATLAGGTISLKRGTTTVTGTSARSGSTLTFTPSSRLSSFTSYTVTITGATSTAGATLPTTSWTFTTGLL